MNANEGLKGAGCKLQSKWEAGSCRPWKEGTRL